MKRTRVRLDRSHTRNFIGLLHEHECKKVCPMYKSPTPRIKYHKVGGRGKRDRKVIETRRLMERMSAQQNENLSEELKFNKAFAELQDIYTPQL